MRRQDVQLVANARQGDVLARCEIGRRYLLGIDGFPRHVPLGLEYLAHPSVAGSTSASVIVAEALPLHRIVALEQGPLLLSVAAKESIAAQVKLGIWKCMTSRDPADSRKWFDIAARSGHKGASAALKALTATPIEARLGVLSALARTPGVDGAEIVMLAMSSAMRADDSELIAQTLACLLHLVPGASPDVADFVLAVLERAQHSSRLSFDASSERIEQCLENCAQRGSAGAALMLGRALCGIDDGALVATSLVTTQNMRRGAAMLLRAADAGKHEAWQLLHRVHSDNRASVANPLMARFFLEKAAASGAALAQRRFGVLILRSAATLHESEQGIRWLHEAAKAQDTLAACLLQSLVLPVHGHEDVATAAIEAIRSEDPWMACRLRTARDFGLTKLEGLSVDLATAVRTWGLVVGVNPFVVQAKRSAPRAVPSLTEAASQNLRRSANLFGQSSQDGGPFEGDLRKRSMRLRGLLERHGADESMFFADVSSTALETLRIGTKWAFHERKRLRLALAA